MVPVSALHVLVQEVEKMKLTQSIKVRGEKELV
jgi:hypothetical protein